MTVKQSCNYTFQSTLNTMREVVAKLGNGTRIVLTGLGFGINQCFNNSLTVVDCALDLRSSFYPSVNSMWYLAFALALTYIQDKAFSEACLNIWGINKSWAVHGATVINRNWNSQPNSVKLSFIKDIFLLYKGSLKSSQGKGRRTIKGNAGKA